MSVNGINKILRRRMRKSRWLTIDQSNSTSFDAVERGDRRLVSNSMALETRGRATNNRFVLSKKREQLMLKVEARNWLDKNAEPV